MAVRAAPDDRQYWVDAAPFRAQLRYLMASASLTSAEEAAAAAGISARLADRLLHGRNGRALRRVSPETGRRLLRLSVETSGGAARTGPRRESPPASRRASGVDQRCWRTGRCRRDDAGDGRC